MYNKARAVIEPFAFEKYRKEKIRQQIDANRPSRLNIKANLPAVNQELALKLMDTQSSKKGTSNLMEDDRFKAMFANPEFQVDKSADEYRMLAPVLTRLDKGKLKELKKKAQQTAVFSQADEEKRNSSDDDLFSEHDDDDGQAEPSSDEDERVWSKDMKKQYRQIRKDNKLRDRRKDSEGDDGDDGDEVKDEDTLLTHEPKMVSLSANEFKVKSLTTKINR